MRMRKKKWTEGFIEDHADIIWTNPLEHTDELKVMIEDKPVHIEIGMGKGDYLLGMCQMYPEEVWIGIEKDRTVAGVAAKKAFETLDESYPRILVGDAERIEEWFPEHSIDVIHLNFSDPWPKKGHHKRRLTYPTFLERYKKLLKEDGKIILKTDNQGFFEDSLEYFLSNGFVLEDKWLDFRSEEHPEDAITEYERRFMDLGQPIYRFIMHHDKINKE